MFRPTLRHLLLNSPFWSRCSSRAAPGADPITVKIAADQKGFVLLPSGGRGGIISRPRKTHFLVDLFSHGINAGRSVWSSRQARDSDHVEDGLEAAQQPSQLLPRRATTCADEPAQQLAQIVPGGRQEDVDLIARDFSERVAAEPVVALQVAVGRLDRRAAFEHPAQRAAERLANPANHRGRRAADVIMLAITLIDVHVKRFDASELLGLCDGKQAEPQKLIQSETECKVNRYFPERPAANRRAILRTCVKCSAPDRMSGNSMQVMAHGLALSRA